MKPFDNVSDEESIDSSSEAELVQFDAQLKSTINQLRRLRTRIKNRLLDIKVQRSIEKLKRARGEI